MMAVPGSAWMKGETLQESTWAALWATDGFHNGNKCPTRVGPARSGAFDSSRVQWLDSLTAPARWASPVRGVRGHCARPFLPV